MPYKITLLSLAFALFCTACNRSDSNSATLAALACRVLTVTDSASGRVHDTYEYDSLNRLNKIILLYNPEVKHAYGNNEIISTQILNNPVDTNISYYTLINGKITSILRRWKDGNEVTYDTTLFTYQNDNVIKVASYYRISTNRGIVRGYTETNTTHIDREPTLSISKNRNSTTGLLEEASQIVYTYGNSQRVYANPMFEIIPGYYSFKYCRVPNKMVRTSLLSSSQNSTTYYSAITNNGYIEKLRESYFDIPSNSIVGVTHTYTYTCD